MHFGLQVEEALDGQQAYEKIKLKKYDIVITDLKMPKLSGDALIRKLINEGHNDLKFIVITGGIATEYSKEQRDQIRNLAHYYFKKPFSENQISQAISEILE